MARNTACSIYIGNLDEKVTERVLYEILMQAGYLVDLHLPRDKESKNHKGFAFAEYETEEVANYAVRLFSGLVRLHNKTLKFAMSGQDKPSHTSAISAANKPNSPTLRKPRPVGEWCEDNSQESTTSMSNSKVADEKHSNDHANYHYAAGNSVPRGLENSNYEFGRRVFGAMLNGVSQTPGRSPLAYPSY